MKKKRGIISIVLISIIAIIFIIPLVYMVSTSLKPKSEVLQDTISLIGSRVTTENYERAWNAFPFARYMFNSIFVGLATTALTVFTSAMAAYAFARLKFKGRDKVFFVYLSTLMVPIQVKAMEADGKSYSPGLTQQVVPDGITAIQASLMITLKETCSAVNRMNVKKEDHIMIVGDGPVGLCFLSNLICEGYTDVQMIGNRDSSLKIAEKIGAKAVCNNHGSVQKDEFLKKEKGKVTLYLDTIGSLATIDQGMKIIAQEGKIAVYGLRTGNELKLDISKMRNFTVQFVQWPIETEEMKTHDQIAEAILKGEINTDLLISHVLPVERFQEGFDAIKEKRALKVALLFGGDM